MQSDHTLLKINGREVGITGLEALFEEQGAELLALPEDEAKDRILTALAASNYIAPAARPHYREALWREFCRVSGRATAESPAAERSGLRIQVVGPGCAQCDRLEQSLYQVLAELELAAAVDHVRGVHEIAALGIMGTPGLIINGKVLAVGKVPPPAQLKKWILAAVSGD